MITNLSHTWFTEGRIDFELKKYTLLSYLQHCDSCFKEKKLYSTFQELLNHHSILNSFKISKNSIENNFHKEIKSLDMENKNIIYNPTENTNKELEELNDIIEYALKKLSSSIEIAKELYYVVEINLELREVGIVPLNLLEGYLIIYFKSEYQVYKYELTIFEKDSERYRGIKLDFLQSFSKFHNFESIKLSLINTNKELPNPAVFAIESKVVYPFTETIFPVIKRTFMRYLTLKTI